MTYQQSEQINELAAALAKAQGQMGAAIKEKVNPAFKTGNGVSRYADLSAVWEAARGPLSSNGLSVAQLPVDIGDGAVGLTTILLHSSGQYISATFSTRLNKDDAQGRGSAITYLRRYALMAVAGIAPDDDDDGAAASRPAQPQQQRRAAEYVPAPEQAPQQRQTRPGTAQEAAVRFYARYRRTLGGDTWKHVQDFLKTNAPEPTTIEGWISAAEDTQRRERETLAQQPADLV